MPPRHAQRERGLRRIVPLAAELPKLIILVAVVTGSFFVTRAAAMLQHRQQIDDAARFSAAGERALNEGRLPEAIGAFRRALSRDHTNDAISSRLAAALAQDGQLATARQVLLPIRDRDPQNAQVNLQLARVAVQQQDPDAAVRYYRSALYLSGTSAEERLDLRLEYCEYLIAQGRLAQAAVELTAAAVNQPAAPMAVRIGDLQLRAGEPARALATFQGVLAQEPADQGALAGAGAAAFALGRYADARTFLTNVTGNPEAEMMGEVARVVLARDPLAARLGAAERRRRATGMLAVATEQLDACRTRASGDAAGPLNQMSVMLMTLQIPRAGPDRDDLETIVDAAGQAARAVVTACPPGSPDMQAIARIAALHGEPR